MRIQGPRSAALLLCPLLAELLLVAELGSCWRGGERTFSPHKDDELASDELSSAGLDALADDEILQEVAEELAEERLAEHSSHGSHAHHHHSKHHHSTSKKHGSHHHHGSHHAHRRHSEKEFSQEDEDAAIIGLPHREASEDGEILREAASGDYGADTEPESVTGSVLTSTAATESALPGTPERGTECRALPSREEAQVRKFFSRGLCAILISSCMILFTRSSLRSAK